MDNNEGKLGLAAINAPEECCLTLPDVLSIYFISRYMFFVQEQSDSLASLLPPEIVERIFGHLDDFSDLCRAGRVCKSWFGITRCRLFWRKISANISTQTSLYITERTLDLIRILPSCVTYISLNSDTVWYMNFRKFSSELRERCPNLRTLILHSALLKVHSPRIADLLHDLPEDLRVLVLTHPYFFFKNNHTYKNLRNKVEVLDVSHCLEPLIDPFSFMHMPNLKILHLAGCQMVRSIFLPAMTELFDQLYLLNLEQTLVDSRMFMLISETSLHLTELYVCWTKVEDADLIFYETIPVFPCLKVICLRGCNVTSNGIASLIKSCPSLDRVLVGHEELNPVIDYTSCNAGIVKILNGFKHCNHNEKVDYMRE